MKELQHRLGLTTIFVTHDQDEALSMSDRVAVMSAGEVQEIGPPEAVYRRPANRFVAEFVGRVNLIEGVATRTDDGGDGLVVTGRPIAATSAASRSTSATRAAVIFCSAWLALPTCSQKISPRACSSGCAAGPRRCSSTIRAS